MARLMDKPPETSRERERIVAFLSRRRVKRADESFASTRAGPRARQLNYTPGYTRGVYFKSGSKCHFANITPGLTLSAVSRISRSFFRVFLFAH